MIAKTRLRSDKSIGYSCGILFVMLRLEIPRAYTKISSISHAQYFLKRWSRFFEAALSITPALVDHPICAIGGGVHRGVIDQN
tara:strand:- start:839 stop:1087 length:249 start_codon:yes stop_codon:yes gene_type:complete